MAGWVCPECGIDYDTISPSDAVVAVRSYPRRFGAALAGPDAEDDPAWDARLHQRPEPTVWSAVEYTAHVADLFDLFADVLRRMAVEDDPQIDFWDENERAEQQHYNDQPRQHTLEGLKANAQRLALVMDGIDAGDWTRTATFPWGERDTLTMARNAVHEGHHHLRDVERVLESLG